MNMWASFAVLVAAFLASPFFLPDPPSNDDVTKLPAEIQEWHKRGKYLRLGRHQIFFLHERCRTKNPEEAPTFAIIHGYPSSSFEYHKIVDKLLEYGNVFVHDHVGFGFSDKPRHNYTYSIGEAAENTLAVWRQIGLKNAHVVSHDMGDTILTEIIARRHRGMLPSHFDEFFQSVTFTNGGMKYSFINFRIGQLLLKNVYFGHYFANLANKLRAHSVFAKKQLRSIWGSRVDLEERERDIEAIIALNSFNSTSLVTAKNIYYLWDRAHFEFRWFEALANIDIRTRFVWADSDDVSPVKIPQFFQSFVPNMEMSYIEDTGHFLMLEQPEAWLREITKVIE